MQVMHLYNILNEGVQGLIGVWQNEQYEVIIVIYFKEGVIIYLPPVACG